MDEIYAYNEYLRQEYERTHDISVLEKYIVSETAYPIEDFDNAKKLIRSHYHELTNSTLLIIGAHLAQYWGVDHNDFLDILNAMYDYLPKKEQAIISYLRAEEMLRDYDFDYKNSAEYKQHLIDSVSKSDFPFVYNREKLAEVSPPEQEIALLQEAIAYTDVSVALAEHIPDTYFCEPKAFIDEFILGTQVPYDRLRVLREKLERVEQSCPQQELRRKAEP